MIQLFEQVMSVVRLQVGDAAINPSLLFTDQGALLLVNLLLRVHVHEL